MIAESDPCVRGFSPQWNPMSFFRTRLASFMLADISTSQLQQEQ